jgi:hypothetical protein
MGPGEGQPIAASQPPEQSSAEDEPRVEATASMEQLPDTGIIAAPPVPFEQGPAHTPFEHPVPTPIEHPVLTPIEHAAAAPAEHTTVSSLVTEAWPAPAPAPDPPDGAEPPRPAPDPERHEY